MTDLELCLAVAEDVLSIGRGESIRDYICDPLAVRQVASAMKKRGLPFEEISPRKRTERAVLLMRLGVLSGRRTTLQAPLTCRN